MERDAGDLVFPMLRSRSPHATAHAIVPVTAAVMSRLTTLRLLGAAAAAERSSDTRGRASPPRRLALIALLAIGGASGVRRDQVVRLLWRNETALHGAALLDELLTALRSEVGDAAVIDDGEMLRFDTTRVTADVIEFETAADAGKLDESAAAYGGEFLEGFFLDDAVDFEQWASDQRIRLTHRAETVLDNLAAAARERGDERRLIDALQRRAEIEPYAAAPTLRLMHALEAAGDAHAALRVGRTYESRIRTFLETDPAPDVLSETRRLRAIVGPLATPSTGNPANTGDKR